MHWCKCVPFSPEASIDQCITRRFCPTGVITVLSWDLLGGEGDRSVWERWTGLQAAGWVLRSLGKGPCASWRAPSLDTLGYSQGYYRCMFTEDTGEVSGSYVDFFSASGVEQENTLQRLREPRWQISILVWQLQEGVKVSSVSSDAIIW